MRATGGALVFAGPSEGVGGADGVDGTVREADGGDVAVAVAAIEAVGAGAGVSDRAIGGVVVTPTRPGTGNSRDAAA